MLSLSQLLLGVGSLDLIRIYQLTKASVLVSDVQNPTGVPDSGGILIHSESESPSGSSMSSMDEDRGIGSGIHDRNHDMVLVYVKMYYLIVAASVFFWNAAIKYITSRPRSMAMRCSSLFAVHVVSDLINIYLLNADKYDRVIYVSRFFMAFVILCLLLVEHHQLGAFTLLGLEVLFCLFQVGHDLLVPYYAVRKNVDMQSLQVPSIALECADH
ncbi:hypothetical protein BGZ51_005291 [Haplosporangium sp. Z 767]|nr:hypothetical protein BGZ51_005291 [Haplosporangium sp. Z 767]KAF9181866.1 hypothetical protein BGZ50_005250 [Haplosporangium sp. Z 11]